MLNFELLPTKEILSKEKLEDMGIMYHGFINIDDIQFSNDVRKICESNGCGKYNKTWACPPAVGEYEDCKNKVLQYNKGLVISSHYELEDSFDFEGMIEAGTDFAKICRTFNGLCQGDFLFLSNRGCLGCKKCTYPDEPCRFPDLLIPPVESYGIWVNKLAESAGLLYHHGPNTVTFFGLLCYERRDNK